MWRKVPAVLNNGGNSHGSAAVASSQFLLHRSFFFIRVAGAAGITGPVLCRSHALCSELEPQLAGIAYVSRFLLCSLPSAPGVKAASCNCHLLYFRAFFYPFYTKRIFKYTLIWINYWCFYVLLGPWLVAMSLRLKIRMPGFKSWLNTTTYL